MSDTTGSDVRAYMAYKEQQRHSLLRASDVLKTLEQEKRRKEEELKAEEDRRAARKSELAKVRAQQEHDQNQIKHSALIFEAKQREMNVVTAQVNELMARNESRKQALITQLNADSAALEARMQVDVMEQLEAANARLAKIISVFEAHESGAEPANSIRLFLMLYENDDPRMPITQCTSSTKALACVQDLRHNLPQERDFLARFRREAFETERACAQCNEPLVDPRLYAEINMSIMIIDLVLGVITV
jgi:hypothetical protein